MASIFSLCSTTNSWRNGLATETTMGFFRRRCNKQCSASTRHSSHRYNSECRTFFLVFIMQTELHFNCSHIGAKFRTRLLKRDRATFLTIGKGIASVSDLEQLLTEVTKGQHHLKNGDLNLHDKMNYDAVRRLCDPCVTDILCDKVAGIIFL